MSKQKGSVATRIFKKYLCPLVEKLEIPKINNFYGRRFFSKYLRRLQNTPLKDIINFVDNDDFVKKDWLKIGKYIASHTLVPQIKRVI